MTFSSAGSVRQQRFKPRPVRVKSTEHINQRADDPLETFRHGRMSGRFEAVPDDTVFRGRLPARVMAAKKIGQVNPQLLRQEVGTGLGCPRGVIGSLAVRSGAAQSDNYVLHAPARADPRFLVVLLVPGIHDLPTEPTAQVVLRGIHGSIVRLPRTRVASSRRPEAPRHRLAGVPSHHPSEETPQVRCSERSVTWTTFTPVDVRSRNPSEPNAGPYAGLYAGREPLLRRAA